MSFRYNYFAHLLCDDHSIALGFHFSNRSVFEVYKNKNNVAIAALYTEVFT